MSDDINTIAKRMMEMYEKGDVVPETYSGFKKAENFKSMLNQVYASDNVAFMNDYIPDQSIDMIMTSPPYDDLRDYKNLEWDFHAMGPELYRILKDGGVMVWVVSDAVIDGSESLSSFKQAIYLVEVCGFNLHDTMLYGKENYQPANLKSHRYAQGFEYTFVFSKGKPKTFRPVMIPSIHGGAPWKSGFRQADGDVRKRKASKINDNKVKSNVWMYKVGYNQSSKDIIAFDHPAIYPEELCKDHIKSWTNRGDIVFDPFAGSGTTLKIAGTWKRNFIGCDKVVDYVEKIAKIRLEPLSTIDMFDSEELDENAIAEEALEFNAPELFKDE